jgi:menaquinone-dependent protoporphyrinogen IX oxidase
MKVLVTAASTHGATAEIAQAIAQTLTEQGLAVTVLPPAEVTSVEEYDAVVIGSAVYVGHWLDAAKDLVNRCHDGLVTRPVWLFSSGPVGIRRASWPGPWTPIPPMSSASACPRARRTTGCSLAGSTASS